MALKTFPFIPLAKKAPTARPERGTVHLRYSPQEEGLVLVNANGESEPISSSAPTAYTPGNAKPATAVMTGTSILNGTVVGIGNNVYPNHLYLFTNGSVVGDAFPPYEVALGASDSESIDNLIAAINGTTGEGVTYNALTPLHPGVLASAGAGDTMNMMAKVVGFEMNNLTCSKSGPGTVTFTDFMNGDYALPGKAGDMMFDTIALYVAVTDVTPTTTDGWKKAALASL
jgi:hypothetical protein